MAATYQSSITMPARFAPVSREEMTYLDGGAWFSFTRQDAMNFGINLVHTAALVVLVDEQPVQIAALVDVPKPDEDSVFFSHKALVRVQ